MAEIEEIADNYSLDQRTGFSTGAAEPAALNLREQHAGMGKNGTSVKSCVSFLVLMIPRHLPIQEVGPPVIAPDTEKRGADEFLVRQTNHPEEYMKQNRPSLTAHKVAMMRAAHQVLDNPRVFEDQIALRIVGTQSDSNIHLEKRKFKTRLHSYLRAIVVARSRFVEDELSMAINRGVRQYVILGAGLDTFAYRNPYSSIGLKVFEVDYPATQEWKLQQLNAAKIPIPETLTFAPVDFENQSLADQLQKVGFRTDEPSFFSWLGVTMYLTRETIMATMEYISSSAPSGSGIVFDYVVHPSSQNFLRRLVFRLLARRMARVGEPWVCFFDPDLLIMDLKTIGFTRVEDIGPDEINARFFKDRADKLMVGNFGHLMKAQL